MGADENQETVDATLISQRTSSVHPTQHPFTLSLLLLFVRSTGMARILQKRSQLNIVEGDDFYYLSIK